MTTETGQSDSPELAQAKRTLRRMAGERRRALACELDLAATGAAAAEHLFGTVRPEPGIPVSGYWPLDAEFDTRPALVRLDAAGHTVGLPVVVAPGEPLQFRRWSVGLDLVEGAFGVMMPGPAAPPVEPVLLLVPMLAFDREGYRLGYGGGFYDRTLALRRAQGRAIAVGIGFAGQEVAHVPRGLYDQPLDWVVTETEAIRIRKR